ncbi:MAG: LptA/OstA family protein [Nitrospinales bacterium]
MQKPTKPKNHFPPLKITFILFIGIFISFSGPLQNKVFSQSTSINADSPGDDEPIEINADRMRSMNNGEKIIFSGNVVGVWGDLEIRSDIFELYTEKKKKKSKKDKKDGQSLEKVIAIGKVAIKRGTTRAKGDRATYYVDEEKIELTGTPKASAWEDGNKIEGKEMIFLLDEDRVVINGRVEAIFFTSKKSPSKSKKRKR